MSSPSAQPDHVQTEKLAVLARRSAHNAISVMIAIVCLCMTASANGSGAAKEYLSVADPLDIVYRRTISGPDRPLGIGVTQGTVVQRGGLMATLLKDGAIVVYRNGQRTGKFYCRVPGLICWLNGRLLYSSGMSVYSYSPATRKKRLTGYSCSVMRVFRCGTGHVTVYTRGASTVVRTSSRIGPARTLTIGESGRVNPMLMCGRYLVIEAHVPAGSAGRLYIIDTVSNSVRVVNFDGLLLGFCRSVRSDEILVSVSLSLGASGIVRRCSLLVVNLVSLAKRHACDTDGQITVYAETDGGRRALSLLETETHGAGNLVSVDLASGRASVVRKSVYRLFCPE